MDGVRRRVVGERRGSRGNSNSLSSQKTFVRLDFLLVHLDLIPAIVFLLAMSEFSELELVAIPCPSARGLFLRLSDPALDDGRAQMCSRHS